LPEENKSDKTQEKGDKKCCEKQAVLGMMTKALAESACFI